MAEWQTRPLDRVYPVVFIDAIHREGPRRPGRQPARSTCAIGVTVDGKRDIFGLWAGTGGEGAKYWLQVLTEIKNRGVDDVCIVVLRRPERPARRDRRDVAAGDRADLRAAPDPQHVPPRRPPATGTPMARDLRPVYTAVNEADAAGTARRVPRRSGATATRRSARCGTTPGPSSCRSSTTPPRSAGSSTRRTPSRASTPGSAERPEPEGTSPTSRPRSSASTSSSRSLDPTGRGHERWMNRWKPALNAFAITFEGRLFPPTNDNRQRQLHRYPDSPASWRYVSHGRTCPT